MKQYLCLAIFSLIYLHVHGQARDTIYYDSKWNKTDKAGKYFYRIVEPSKLKAHLLVKDFYPNDSKQMEGDYLSVDPDIRDGEFTWWYENGKLKQEATFDNNQITKIKNWDEEGQLTMEKEFVRITKKENGEDEYRAIEAAPKFPGGKDALYHYIEKNVKYPLDAKKGGIEGSVVVRFIIDKEGKVINPEVVKSLYPSLDAEALRLMKKMPRWKPGKQDGKYIRVILELPINFSFKRIATYKE